MQIVTTRPKLDAWEGSLTTGLTTTDGGSTGTIVEGVVNVPLLHDRLALRVVGYSEDAPGYVSDPARGLADVDSSRRRGLRASLLWRINDQWRWRGTFVGQTIHTDDSHYSEAVTGPYARDLALSEPARNDFDGVSSLLEGNLGWGRLKISTAFQNYQLSSRYDATLSLPLLSPGAEGPAAFDDASHIGSMVWEAALTSPADSRLTWLGGLFFSKYVQDADGQLTTTSVLYAEDRRDHIDEYALYGEVTAPIGRRLRLTLGGRYYRLAVKTDAAVTQPTLPVSSFAGDTANQGFAPKVLVEYDLSDRMLLYAQATEGYRAGGFNTSGLIGQPFSTPGAGSQPYRQFSADEMHSYELGMRTTLFDARLKVRAAIFRAEWSDIQSDRLLVNGLPFTANIGDGRNTGLELDAGWCTDRWTLDADLLLNDPELARPDPGFPIPADRHLSGIPTAMVNLAAKREWHLGRTGPSIPAERSADVSDREA